LSTAYIGIGSNLDRPSERVNAAFEALTRLPATRLVKRSSLYRSEPQGHREQPDFVNAVAALESELSAASLLKELHDIEARAGRERSFANAPRTLDLDLLLYGDACIEEPGLIVPHPRMHQRAFVLVPLLEIAPSVSIPGLGPASAYVPGTAGQKLQRLT
jgi:2-amino-4-hydroxy-6-hydroxymethyldihydropteridine diphosphokinase